MRTLRAPKRTFNASLYRPELTRASSSGGRCDDILVYRWPTSRPLWQAIFDKTGAKSSTEKVFNRCAIFWRRSDGNVDLTDHLGDVVGNAGRPRQCGADTSRNRQAGRTIRV